MVERRIVILTGVSCSGKSSLSEKILEDINWDSPINFTTRQPRNSWENKEYIFTSIDKFLDKVKNKELLEFTIYWDNLYWISNNFPDCNLVLILDPIWKAQAIKYFSTNNINYESYYLNISKDLQIERLKKRWDSIEEIEKRTKDFDWFSPTKFDIILDWKTDTDTLADNILRWLYTEI